MNEEEFAEYLQWLEAAADQRSAPLARVRRPEIAVRIEASAPVPVEGTA